jgi:hypothetical protein
MTRVVIHIGAGKCGSSAIQHYLKSNREKLLTAGVLVPDKDGGVQGKIIGQQVWYFEKLQQLPAAEARGLWRRHCTELLEFAAGQGVHSIVFSAENLINPTHVARLLSPVTELAEVQVVLYVRRQLDYLVSAWQQWYLKTHSSVEQFLQQNLGVLANWNSCLSDWESEFGCERIMLRRYGQGLLAGDHAAADFLVALGLADTLPAPQYKRVNRSYSDAMTALAMRARDQFSSMHDNAFYLGLEQLVGELAWREERSSYPFDASQVELIERAYEADNNALRDKYLPTLSGPLFKPAAAEGIVPLTAQQERLAVDLLLDAAAARLQQLDSFDYAPVAEFSALLETLRESA